MKKILLGLIAIPIFINTGGHSINAVEGNLRGVTSVSDASSVISLWIEKPTAENNFHFAGIIPGGLQTGRALLFRVVPQEAMSPEIKFTRVLLNNGLGADLASSLIKTELGAETDDLADQQKPEDFVPVIARDQNLFENQWFLSFNTQDKQSGIDHYEIAETWKKWNLAWTKAESPYLLRDQKLHSYLYVKVVDHAGNERVAVLPPKLINNPYAIVLFWGIIIIMIITLSYKYGKRLLVLLALLVFLLPSFTQAAQLSISATPASYRVGDIFNLRIFVNSPGETLNAVSGSISFPPDKLQVLSVNSSDSIISLWAAEPSFSNNSGKINFEGVVLNPGFTGNNGQIVSVKLKAISTGSATISFSGGSILANDGQGTDILDKFNNQTVNISAAESGTPKPETETKVVETVPATYATPTAPAVTESQIVVAGRSYSEVLLKVLLHYIGVIVRFIFQPVLLSIAVVVLLIWVLVLRATVREDRDMIKDLEKKLTVKKRSNSNS